ncbi:MAG: aminotransferase class I/II-fold pyridoxal phosphate-dependent enzyme, partial [Clostridia bacterium]|nr:aminotransferase class I/II-fold pyridoxal phosphate-dependent enzyme [Clostridia bacterium]
PDLKGAAARRGMAAHLGIPEACVLVTAGGIEAAALAASLPGNHVIAQPTFQEYGRLCGEYQGVLREKLHEHRFSKGEILWICNPNNPTGDALSRDFLSELLDRAVCAGAGLVVDEAFIEYCPDHSVADLAAKRPALTILGSLTKVLAIPGARLGYIVAEADVTSRLSEGLLPWRVNCVADAVAAALPGHRADFDAIRRLNDQRRARFARGLEALGVRVYPSDANFLLCDFGRDMRPVIEQLRARGMLVRPCGMFPGLNDGFVRLCVRTEAENARLVAVLGEFRE